ncbi:MAG: hypothetical protein V3V00_12155 [Saprospiraceae bacterium]
MKDFKLIRVLKKLSDKELEKLVLFINSPYFDFNSKTTNFFAKLLSILNATPIDFNLLWQGCFVDKYTDQRLSKMLFQCLQIVEKFLAIEHFQSDEIKTEKELLNAAIDKNLIELIPKSLKSLQKLLNESQTLTFEYYSNRYELFNLYYNLPGGFDRKIAIKKNKDSSEFLLKADRILNEIFLSEKLRLAHLLENDNSVSNKKDKLTFIDEVFNFAKNTARKGSKPHFYLQLYALSKADNKLEEVKKLHKYVSKRSKIFSNLEFRNILFTLLNEAIRISNLTKTEAYFVTFDLYQIGLKNDTFLVNSELLPDTFRNVVFNACKLKEFDWALDFIDQYQEKLNPKYQKTAVSFNKAIVFRSMGNYNKVIELLIHVEYEDLGYNIRSKLMLLISYFELNEFDTLDSLIKSFNVFLRRKTAIPTARKSSFLNFNTTLQNIVRVKERRDKVKLKSIRAKLESKMIARNKSWLLEKVEELEKEMGVVRREGSRQSAV